MVWNHISDEDWFRINTNVQLWFSSKTSLNFIRFIFVPKSNAHTNKFKLHKELLHSVSKVSYWNIRIYLGFFCMIVSLEIYMQQQYKDFTYVTSWGYYCCHCKSYSKESYTCLLQFLSSLFSRNCFSYLIISYYLNLIWMCNMMSANLMDTPFKMSVHSYINILEDEWM